MKLKRSLVAEASYNKNHPADQWMGDGEDNETVQSQAMRWEFGQVLPVLLLAAPLVTMFGIFSSVAGMEESRSATAQSTTPENLRTLNTAIDSSSEFRTSLEPLEMIRLHSRERSHDEEQEEINEQEPNLCAVDCQVPRSLEGMENSVTTVFLGANNMYVENWMLGYLTSSLIVLFIHVSCVFAEASNMFRRSDDPDYIGIWTPIEYLFLGRGVFFQAVLSYTFGSVGIVLLGISIEEWIGSKSGPEGRVRELLFLVFAVCHYVMYLWIIYIPPGDWSLAFRVGIISCVTAGFFFLYLLTCVLVCLSRRWP